MITETDPSFNAPGDESFEVGDVSKHEFEVSNLDLNMTKSGLASCASIEDEEDRRPKARATQKKNDHEAFASNGKRL